jgi:hypothetical protein
VDKLKIGINFHGFKCACYQNRSLDDPPENYISDSFKIFSENGLNCIRIPVYWESYEKDPDGFIQELDTISNEADKYEIECIYDNHQWNCSSFLGFGIGFPNSILSLVFKNKQTSENSLEPPSKTDLTKFWNDWWDRKIKNSELKDGWEMQLEFLQTVIERVNHKKSTFGFEILNEPQVFRQKDFKIVGNYHYYFLKNLEVLTDKTLFFCYTSSGSSTAINFPWEQAKTKPSIDIKNHVIFDVHPYPPYYVTILYYKLISVLMRNNLLFIGEFNSGIGKNTTVNLSQYKKYLTTLKNSSIQGAALWYWSHLIDNDHPSFNLTKIDNQKIYPNDNFENFIRAIQEKYN